MGAQEGGEFICAGAEDALACDLAEVPDLYCAVKGGCSEEVGRPWV